MTHSRTQVRTLVFALCLVLAAAAAPVSGLLGPAGPNMDIETTSETDGNAAARGDTDQRVVTETPTPDGAMGTNWTADPERDSDRQVAGEAFASAVAAHDSALEGDLRSRALDRRLATAGNGTARARLLGDTVRSVRLRLAVLDSRRERLRAARRNGTLDRGSYRVAMARLTAEARSLRRMLDRVDGAASRLPATTRATYGLENATLDELRTRAEVVGNQSAIALGPDELDSDVTLDTSGVERPSLNGSLADGTDTLNTTDWYTEVDSETDTTFENTTTDDTGDRYPERRMTLLTLDGNATELEGVHDYLADRSDGDREAEEALACARDAIDDARADIDDAGLALDDGDPARADDLIADARAALTTARDCLEQARAALQDDDGTSTPTDWQQK